MEKIPVSIVGMSNLLGVTCECSKDSKDFYILHDPTVKKGELHIQCVECEEHYIMENENLHI